MTSPWERLKLGVTRNWKITAISIVAVYGVLWSLIEPFNGLMPKEHQIEGVGKYLTLVIIAIIAGLFHLYPKTKIILPLHLSDTTIEVLFGDLFAEDGQKVIAVNDFFDSELGKVVAPTSLHGVFITKYFHGVSKDFDGAVSLALNGVKADSVSRPDGGKPLRYPIGTTAYFVWKGQEFYLPVIARTDTVTSVANATVTEFWQALEGLWKSARENSNDADVVVPLLGSGLSRVGLPQSQLLYFVISSFVAETKKQKVTRRLKIVLHKDLFDRVDLSEFERNWNQ